MNWRLDYLQRLQGAPSEEGVMDRLTAIVQGLGFDYCAFGIQCNVSLTKPATGIFNNYPRSWQERYVANDYLAIDPTVHHAIAATTPLVWDESLFRDVRPFWEDARAHGLATGWGMPTRGQGATVGLMSVARSGDNLSSSELDAVELRLIYLAQIAHAAIAGHWLPRNVPETTTGISRREREVLLWAAEGKTIPETASIMGIRDRTVQFHLYGLMDKLNVHNKSQLVMKAAMLGLLK